MRDGEEEEETGVRGGEGGRVVVVAEGATQRKFQRLREA